MAKATTELKVISSKEVIAMIDENQASKAIDIIDEQLKLMGNPKSIISEFDGTQIDEVDDIYELIDLRIVAKKYYVERELERKELSGLIKTKIPAQKCDTLEEVLEAITARANVLMNQTKIENLQKARNLASKLITEEEKKTREKLDAITELNALLDL